MAQTGADYLSGAEALTNAQRERVWKFAKQSAKYPLSAEGARLLEGANRLLAGNFESTQEINFVLSALPTVEMPRPELFRDLDSTGLGMSDQDLFGPKLANVQVTKGCSHQCTFCAADASKGVSAMPFSAIVKLGQKLTQNDEAMKSNWDSWAARCQELTGKSIQDPPNCDPGRAAVNERFRYRRFLVGKPPKIPEELVAAFRQHPLAALFDTVLRYEGAHLQPREKQLPLSWLKLRRSICNFYDSDPFDYQDPHFCHDDGTPAHFGDVAAALATEFHPIDVTTAGWPSTHAFAGKAASKLVELYRKNPRLIYHVRVSVNPSEIRARRAYLRHGSYEEYCVMMQQVLESLAPLSPEILFFYDGADERLEDDGRLFKPTPQSREFFEQVCLPLRGYMQESNEAQQQKRDTSSLAHYFEYRSLIISTFSGPEAEPTSVSHDVMACMPGWHILPDGQLCEQPVNPYGSEMRVTRGSRPVPLAGKKLW